MIRKIGFALFLLALSTSAFAADATVLESSSQRATLIELFTSEGCGGCPQADNWMRSLQVTGDLWTKTVPVVFHVSTWDHAGWKDTLALASFTQRQVHYGASWGRAAYTPCFALNGKEWPGWAANQTAPKPPAQDAGILRVTRLDAKSFAVHFAPAKGQRDNYLAHVVLLGFGIVSDVTHGENQGRRLRHDFVALGYGSRALESTGQEEFVARIAVENQLQAQPTQLGIACWITPRGSMVPVQATGGYLP